MFARGDRVKITRMITLPGDIFVGIKDAFYCLGNEGRVDEVYPENPLAYGVKMDDPGLKSSFWREEELEHV